jgi:hypothetical protein
MAMRYRYGNVRLGIQQRDKENDPVRRYLVPHLVLDVLGVLQ